MRLSISALSLLSVSGVVCAQTAAWQPAAGHTQIPIWPDAEKLDDCATGRFWPAAGLTCASEAGAGDPRQHPPP